MTLTVLFTLTSVVYAQTPSTWQNSATGLKTASNTAKKTAGLTITINASATPSAYLQGGVQDGGWSKIGGPTGIKLGEIKISGTVPAIVSESADWAHNQMTFTNNLNIWVSRLSPAILIQNQNPNSVLRLFSGNLDGATTNGTAVTNRTVSPAYPKYIAYSSGGTIKVAQIPPSSSASLNLPTLDNNWVMVWYGNNSYFTDTKLPLAYSANMGHGWVAYSGKNAYQADAPILLKFENNPTSIKQSPEGGIDLTFTTNSGYTSIMPLFGREHLKASDTEGWGTISTLPLTVTQKINFWTNRLCSYPTNISETYGYNTNTDTATISENITYLPVCSSGSTTSGFAILPPMLAIAKDALGTNFSVSKTLTDANYPTEFGPILGVENTNTYSYSVTGLKKYTDNKRVLSNGTVPTELIQELTKQVDETTKSGHLKPWLYSDHLPRNDTSGDVFFLNPTDVIYSLAEIVPILPEPQKTNLINYIKSERTNYPPETMYNLPNTGTLRTPFALDNYNLWQSSTTYGTKAFLKKVPLYSFLGLSRYYDLTGELIPAMVITSAKTALDSDAAEQDWATSSWFKGFGVAHTAVGNTNRYLTGLIGFTKLSEAVGDSYAEGLGRALFAKTALTRLAMAKYPRYLYTANIVSLPTDPAWMPKYTTGSWMAYIWNYNWTTPFDDAQQVGILDQFGTYLYDNSSFMSPGTGWGADSEWLHAYAPFLTAYRDLVPESFRLLKDFAGQEAQIQLNKYTTLLPHWYTGFVEGTIGIEHDLEYPISTFQIFMAKTFLQNETPQNLARYSGYSLLDSGDFFYMQKLAETIKAYQGWAWSDTITGQPCTLTSASWGSTTASTGQAINLNAVATGDCSGKTVTFEVHRNGVGDTLSAITNQPNPQTISFNGGNQVSNTWIAEHNPFIPLTDPDYYFKATLSGGNVIDTTKSLLHVTNPVGGGPTPTPIPPTPTIKPTNTPTPTLVASASATPIPTTTPTPVPCALASASWSTTTTTQGSSVDLNVVGNTNCAGKQVSFEVRRNGTLIDDIPANIQPQTASMSATLQASTTWVAERNPLIPFTDAQYYFKAIPQGGVAINTKPQLLTVTQAVIVPTAPNDWPQVQKDAQHTGYSSETLGTNFKVKFTYAFQPDKVFPQVQAIIYQGKAFVGTEGANGQKPTLYAIDAVNPDSIIASKGKVIWKFEAGGSIVNSVAAYDNKIFFGAMDGAVYALNSSNGAQIWKNQLSSRLGFSTAPVIADNKVMLGGQDGNFYALDPNDGHVIWKYNAGAPILQTAAYDQGKVFFGSQDMYVYGINTTNGTQVWKSQKFFGSGFKDYWPVITQGKVFIRPLVKEVWYYLGFPGISSYPFTWMVASQATWLNTYGPMVAAGNTNQVPDIVNIQNTAMAKYQANPSNYHKNLYILDENTGLEPFAVPHWQKQTMDGGVASPCVDRDKKLITPIDFIRSGWGRLEIATNSGRITDILYDGYKADGKPYDLITGGSPAGMGNGDENLAVSCTANLVLAVHYMEGNANYTGAFNLDTRRWTGIAAGWTNRQMFDNTQSGGTNPFSISNGMIYHISIHELIVRSTN